MNYEVFIGNTRTMIYHRPNCHCNHMIEEQNKVTLDDDYVPSRFRPCSKCKPEGRKLSIRELLA